VASAHKSIKNYDNSARCRNITLFVSPASQRRVREKSDILVMRFTFAGRRITYRAVWAVTSNGSMNRDRKGNCMAIVKVLCVAMVGGLLVLPLGGLVFPYLNIPNLPFSFIEAVVSASLGFGIADLLS